jgi:hypothetical protein
MDFFGGIVDTIRDGISTVDDFFGAPVVSSLGKAFEGGSSRSGQVPEGLGIDKISRMGRGSVSEGQRPEDAESFYTVERTWAERLNKFRNLVNATETRIK